MNKPEFNMISIYPLMDIQEINDYSEAFDGIAYDNDLKVKVAREIARWYAEMRPFVCWERYYPTNEEMDGIISIANRIMKRKPIIKAIPDNRFRFSMIIDYIMSFKKVYKVQSFREMIEMKSIIINTIVEILKE